MQFGIAMGLIALLAVCFFVCLYDAVRTGKTLAKVGSPYPSALLRAHRTALVFAGLFLFAAVSAIEWGIRLSHQERNFSKLMIVHWVLDVLLVLCIGLALYFNGKRDPVRHKRFTTKTFQVLSLVTLTGGVLYMQMVIE